MSLSKESKIRILENFYAVDYVLFGKPVSKLKETCCESLIDEYTSIKGAMLSVLIELYKLVNHQPEAVTETVDSKILSKMARESAKLARQNCENLVTSSKGRADIKAELREAIEQEQEVDIEEMVKTKIREKAYRLAIDNLLIAKTISESSEYKKMNEWEGRIVEDAYKILRDSLVEEAMLILEDA
jgi:molybdopterin-biosynthesis enzyme MoeA-like protein